MVRPHQMYLSVLWDVVGLSDGSKAIGAVMLSILAAVAVISLYSASDSDHVDLIIVQHGEGTVDPAPGEYSASRGDVVKVSMVPAEGWILADIVVNGKGMPTDIGILPYSNGDLVITLGSDTVIHVHFALGEVQVPEASEFTFTGDLIEAYSDNSLYTVTGGSATDAGVHTAVFSLRSPEFSHWSDGSVDDKTVAWSILPKEVSEDDLVPIPGQVYSGVPLEPALVTLAPMRATDVQSVAYVDNTFPGTASVEVIAKGNYTGSVVLTFDIARAPVTVSVTDASKVYGDSDPTFQTNVSGLVAGEPVAYNLTRAQGESVGEYTVTPVGDDVQGNYDVTYVPGILTIHPRQVVVNTGSADKVYDGTPLTDGAVSISGVLPCDAYSLSVTGSITDVGEVDNWYTIVWSDPGDADNYVLNGVLGTLRVDPYVLTADDFSPIAPIVYTGSQICPDVFMTTALLDIGLTVGTDCIVTYGDNMGTGEHAGTITITGTHNATGEVTLDFGIYHGVTVYVTRDGSGNAYAEGERSLSSFGHSTGTLFDMGNVVPGQFQYVEMYVANHAEYVGMELGMMLSNPTGADSLYSGIELMIQSGGTLRKMTLEEASQGIVGLGTITSADDIGMTVTMIVPEGLGGSGVQGVGLDFTLVLCVMSPDTGGQ